MSCQATFNEFSSSRGRFPPCHDAPDDHGSGSGRMTTRPCAVVVDGGAALPEDLAHGVAVVPVRITIGDAEFVDDGGSVDYSRFYERLREGQVPHTSTPSPGEYLAAFRRCEAQHIVCITIPAKWSGMHDSA